MDKTDESICETSLIFGPLMYKVDNGNPDTKTETEIEDIDNPVQEPQADTTMTKDKKVQGGSLKEKADPLKYTKKRLVRQGT